jgi:hypothetical protein
LFKKCCRCKSEKPRESFSRNRAEKDGLQNRCKACDALVRVETNAKACVRSSWLKYGEIYRARAREKKTTTKWKRRNPERNAATERNRRAKKAAAGGVHAAEQIAALLVKQKWKCAICTASLRGERHADHITPLALGGSNDITNIQMLCPPCNARKWKRDPIAFMQSCGFLL